MRRGLLIAAAAFVGVWVGGALALPDYAAGAGGFATSLLALVAVAVARLLRGVVLLAKAAWPLIVLIVSTIIALRALQKKIGWPKLQPRRAAKVSWVGPLIAFVAAAIVGAALVQGGVVVCGLPRSSTDATAMAKALQERGEPLRVSCGPYELELARFLPAAPVN